MALQLLRVRLSSETRANTLRYELDGVVYEFTFRRSGRNPEAWYMTVATGSGTVQVAGIAVVPGVELLRQWKHLELPPGQLFAYDTSKSYTDPTPDEMDDRVVLLYRPLADVPADSGQTAQVVSVTP